MLSLRQILQYACNVAPPQATKGAEMVRTESIFEVVSMTGDRYWEAAIEEQVRLMTL